jgi:phosphatidylinositol phospholipase C beta
LFAQNREDRKRVEKALDISGLPSGKVRKSCDPSIVTFNSRIGLLYTVIYVCLSLFQNDALSLQKFQFEDFFNFYKSLTHRVEVEKIFEEM